MTSTQRQLHSFMYLPHMQNSLPHVPGYETFSHADRRKAVRLSREKGLVNLFACLWARASRALCYSACLVLMLFFQCPRVSVPRFSVSVVRFGSVFDDSRTFLGC